MEEANVVSVGVVVAGSLWAAVAGLVIGAWILFIWGVIDSDLVAASGKQRLAFMLMLTACPLSAVAATAQIRTFTARTRQMIRMSYRGADLSGLRSIPRQGERHTDPVR